MNAKTASPEMAVLTAERKLHNTWVYIKRHWQLYLLFLLPAVALTLVFKYAPMGGVLIAFQKYNPFKGIWGSEWVGFKNFTRFMSSPDFQRYLINTLKLSVYGLLWGFPIPILLAFLLNRMNNDYVYPNVFMSNEDTEQVSNLQADLQTYMNTQKANWIMNGTTDAEWNEYLSKLEAYGLSDYLGIMQKYLDAYYA